MNGIGRNHIYNSTARMQDCCSFRTCDGGLGQQNTLHRVCGKLMRKGTPGSFVWYKCHTYTEPLLGIKCCGRADTGKSWKDERSIFGCDSDRIYGITAGEDQPCIRHISRCDMLAYQRCIG